MDKHKVIIGVDPGLTGSISILIGDNLPLIYKIPVIPIIVNKKKKNTYDMKEIVKIFSLYRGKDVMFNIEIQGVRYGEGNVSSFTIGRGFGFLLGSAYALGFEVIEVRPQVWKKSFPELITQGIIDKKAEIKEIKVSFKKELNRLNDISKKLKDNKQKKENKEEVKILTKETKRQIDKLNRQIKAEAKTNARELAMKLYPKIANKFEKKNTDGLAESLLIALYGKEMGNELV